MTRKDRRRRPDRCPMTAGFARRPATVLTIAFGLTAVLVLTGGTSARGAVNLGTADPFAVLAASTITNTGPTTINGDVGLYPGTAVTGFGSVTQTGSLETNNGRAQGAEDDANTAYVSLQGRSCATDLTGQVLGQTVGTVGNPLAPGVYCFSSSAQEL